MLRLNKLTDYAVVILSRLAKDRNKVYAAAYLAVETRIPLPTVSKILKILSNSSLICSHRGSNGGYCLGRNPDSIPVTEIVQAFEGPISLSACVTASTDQCSIEAFCPIRGNWNKVNEAIKGALENLTLADLLDPSEPIQRKIKVQPNFIGLSR